MQQRTVISRGTRYIVNCPSSEDVGPACEFGTLYMMSSDLLWYSVNLTGTSASNDLAFYVNQTPLNWQSPGGQDFGYQLLACVDNTASYQVYLSGSAGNVTCSISQTPWAYDQFNCKPYLLLRSVTDDYFYPVYAKSGSIYLFPDPKGKVWMLNNNPPPIPPTPPVPPTSSCIWYAVDYATATGPESYVAYNSLEEARVAAAGFSQPAFGRGANFPMEDWTGTPDDNGYVSIVLNNHNMWDWNIGVPPLDYGNNLSTFDAAFNAVLSSSFKPVDFCPSAPPEICVWYAGDLATAQNPEDYVAYNGFDAALTATNGFTQPDLVWGDITAYWNGGITSNDYVDIYYGGQSDWQISIGLSGSSDTHFHTGYATAQEALSAVQSSWLRPDNFCPATSSKTELLVTDPPGYEQYLGTFTYGNIPNMTTLTIYDSSSLAGYDIKYCSNLTEINFPNLVSIDPENTQEGYFFCQDSPSITTLNLSSLDSVGNGFYCYGNTSLTTLDLSSLSSVGGNFYCHDNTSLTTLDLSSLSSVGGYFVCYNNTSLTTLDLSSLSSVGNYFDCYGCALSATSIEGVLAKFVAMSVTGKDINLSGGTNAGVSSLSVQGQSDYAALVAAGNSITINT